MNAASCSCSRIEYELEEISVGVYTPAWRCQHCAREFVPRTMLEEVQTLRDHWVDEYVKARDERNALRQRLEDLGEELHGYN